MYKSEKWLIPYLRYSISSQGAGRSEIRQLESHKWASDYATQNGFAFHDAMKLRDRGVSGYSGKNRTAGDLGKILAAAEDNKIPKGSALFVENLDRLSREGPTTVLKEIIFKLFDRGIGILVRYPEVRVYTQDSLDDLFDELASELKRAKGESKRKSDFMRFNWADRKKAALQRGQVLTKRCPAWLEIFVVDDVERYRPISAAAETVQIIFRWYVSGLGKAIIAQKLNSENYWKPHRKDGTSNGWRPSYIHKILTNRSVIGELQTYTRRDGKREPEGEPRADFYPKVIEQDLFNAAQRRIEKNKGKGGRTSKARNLFQNIAKCPYCGGSMVLKDKGQGSKGGRYLECDNGQRFVRNEGRLVCAKHRVQYGEVQETVLLNCRGLRPERVLPDDTERTRICEMLRTRIAGAETEIKENGKRIANADELIFGEANEDRRNRWRKRLLELETRNTNLQARLKADRAELQRDEQSRETFTEWQRNLEGLKGAIAPEDAVEARIRLQAHLKDLITKIEIFTEGYADRQELGVDKKRRPKALSDKVDDAVWLREARLLQPKADEIEAYLHATWDEAGCPTVTRSQLEAFVDYVLKRRMSKEGRFFRVHFTTGTVLDLVPAGSIASGIQLVTSDKGKESLKFVEPSVSLLWQDFVAHSRADFRSEMQAKVS